MVSAAFLLTLMQTQNPAHAGPVVLVAPFRTEQEQSEQTAATVTGRIADALASDFEVMTIDQVPDFPDYSARVYLESCPKNEYHGCLYVLANRVTAAFAIGGLVKEVDVDEKEIEWMIVDKVASKVALALRVNVTPEKEEIFYGGIARTLALTANREAAAEDLRGPIREETSAMDDAEKQEKQTAAALEVMGMTMNIDEMVALGRGLDLTHQKITEEELLASVDEDAALAPWDYLHMTQEEYLDFRNSGSTELDWRRKKLGRTGTFVFHVGGGLTHGSFGVLVDGRYAQDPNAGFAIADTRTETARMASYSPTIDLAVRYGFSRNLDVGVALRHAIGWKQSAYFIETIGDSLPIATGGGDESYLSRRVGLTADWVQDPNAPIQFSLGASAGLLFGWEVTRDTDAPTGILPVTLPTSPYLIVTPTLSKAVSERVSLSLALDLGVEFGARSASVREGQPALMTTNTPEAGSPFMFGLSVQMAYRTQTTKKVALYEGELPMDVE